METSTEIIFGIAVFLQFALSSVRKGHLVSYSLPFSICHLFCLCLCYVQGKGCKIPASQFIASVSVDASGDFFPCGTLPAGSCGHFTAKSFQLFHYKLKHQPHFPVCCHIFDVPFTTVLGLTLTFSVQ